MNEDPRPLAPWATKVSQSLGRRHPQPPSRERSEFERDCDRIIHCAAFRRLENKMQVFSVSLGDHFRTRLTHTLEVAQIARRIAGALQLNTDLAEAIALAHDLGHAPFGHIGQSALQSCMRDFGEFEHNLQGLRIVDELEIRYPDFDGLNLTFETREGILKHCEGRPAHSDALRFVAQGLRRSLEAQVVDISDTIAYCCHDIDDGLRAGILVAGELERDAPVYREEARGARRDWPGIDAARLSSEIVRRMIGSLVEDTLETSAAALLEACPRDAAAARAWPTRLVTLSADGVERLYALRGYLTERLYLHPDVNGSREELSECLRFLWRACWEDGDRLPGRWNRGLDRSPERARAACDWVSGMTDRMALRISRQWGGPYIPPPPGSGQRE